MALGFIVLLLVIFLAVVAMALKQVNEYADSWEIALGVIYIVSLGLFMIGMMIHNNPYDKAIDPVDSECYSPFANGSMNTLIFYFSAFNIALLLVWVKKTMLPPLTLALSMVFITIGIMISCVIVLQLSYHDTHSIGQSHPGGELLLLFAPLSSIVIGSSLLIKTILQKSDETTGRVYTNKYLGYLNEFLATRSTSPAWIFILLLPVLFLSTLILVLFGQDFNSIVKVFTDTTTWKFSQQTHPPILDHHGHYLCTVAAAGDPKIVKPIRIGQRNGREIIVNRQLQIANAFEELVQDLSPKLHRVIRSNYDRYGYDLSKKINTTTLSNITYILMKPLEWFFLICLYLLCSNPELKINKQYTAQK